MDSCTGYPLDYERALEILEAGPQPNHGHDCYCPECKLTAYSHSGIPCPDCGAPLEMYAEVGVLSPGGVYEMAQLIVEMEPLKRRIKEIEEELDGMCDEADLDYGRAYPSQEMYWGEV